MQVTSVQSPAGTSSNNDDGGSKRNPEVPHGPWGPVHQRCWLSARQQIAGLTMTKNTDFTVAQKGNQTIDQRQLQTLGGWKDGAARASTQRS